MSKNKPLQNTNGNSHQVAILQHIQPQRTVFDPEVVERYAQLVPNAPERILTILELNNKTERIAREALINDSVRRDWMAFVIVLAGIAASVALAYMNKPYLSAATIATMVVYAVVAFVSYRHNQRESK